MFKLEYLLFLIGVLVFNTGVSEEIQETRSPTGSGSDVTGTSPTSATDELAETELVMIHSVFRHGDRSPDKAEMDLFPLNPIDDTQFFPDGLAALTNKGKFHAYLAGQNMRQRYNTLLSSLYLPDQIRMRTTNFDRTKMSALTLLAGLYPPQRAQIWNHQLEWQPIPYDTDPAADDDLLYYYNCPRYSQLLRSQSTAPEASKLLEHYSKTMHTLSENSGNNITIAENVFFLDNLFQAEENVGLDIPEWAMPLMSDIKKLTKIAFTVKYSTDEMVQLSGGPLLHEVLRHMEAAGEGRPHRRAHLYSAHEVNVAALMAAVRVFVPHQPAYASVFTLELRRHLTSGEYGVTAVYVRSPWHEAEILAIPGCGIFCPLNVFAEQSKALAIDRDQYKQLCRRKPETAKSDKNDDNN